MTFEEASKRFNLPVKVFYHLCERGFITGTTLTDADVKTVELVSRIFGDPVLLRTRLAKFSKARREDLIRTANLNKWESYIFNRYRNHIMKKSGKRLYVKRVANEINYYYRVEKSFTVIRRIYQLRKRAYKSLGKKESNLAR
ncbi:MAG: hypothetical protein ACE14T_12715 [Syntrophales bacterium]